MMKATLPDCFIFINRLSDIHPHPLSNVSVNCVFRCNYPNGSPFTTSVAKSRMFSREYENHPRFSRRKPCPLLSVHVYCAYWMFIFYCALVPFLLVILSPTFLPWWWWWWWCVCERKCEWMLVFVFVGCLCLHACILAFLSMFVYVQSLCMSIRSSAPAFCVVFFIWNRVWSCVGP